MRALSRDNRLLWLVLFLWGIGEGLFTYQLPLYLKQLGANPLAIGTAFSLAGAATAFSHLPAGLIADRLGHRRVVWVAYGLCLLSTLGMYLAPTLALFVPAMVVFYLTGFSSVPLNAYMAQARGQQSVQRAITLVWTGYWAATVFSPVLGGLISRVVGLRPLFGLGAVVFVAGMALLLFLREQRSEVTTAARTPARELLRNRRYLAFVGLVSASIAAMYFGLAFAPSFVAEVRGFDTGVVGLLGSANAVGALLLNLVIGHLWPRRAFLAAQAGMLLSYALLLTLGSVPGLLAAFALQASYHLARHLALPQISSVVPAAEIGRAVGLLESTLGVVLAVEPVIAGLLYDRSPYLPFQISLGLLLVTIPLFAWLAPRRVGPPELVPISAV